MPVQWSYYVRCMLKCFDQRFHVNGTRGSTDLYPTVFPGERGYCELQPGVDITRPLRVSPHKEFGDNWRRRNSWEPSNS